MTWAAVVGRGVRKLRRLPQSAALGAPRRRLPSLTTFPERARSPLVVSLLAIAGVLVLLLRSELDGFWRFGIAATFLGPVPAALTKTDFQALRALPLVVGLLTLSDPGPRGDRPSPPREAPVGGADGGRPRGGLARLARPLHAYLPYPRPPSEAARLGCTGLHRRRSRRPTTAVHSARRPRRSFGTREWYADLHHLPRDRIVSLPAGERPPSGVISLRHGRSSAASPCKFISVVGSNWLARAS